MKLALLGQDSGDSEDLGESHPFLSRAWQETLVHLYMRPPN